MAPEHNTKLYRSHVLHQGTSVLRHRGKSPRQAAFFFRSPELQFHAANLASLFLLYGLLRATSNGVESSYRVDSLESGALLCRGYEAYSGIALAGGHLLRACLVLVARSWAARRDCAQAL
jgi:hypothetical protein